MRQRIFVLDACALLAFWNDEEGSKTVEAIFKAGELGDCQIYMHKLNLLEVYYAIYRQDGQIAAENSLKKLTSAPLTIVEVISDAVFKEAGRLKASYRLSLADAIALAEAEKRRAHLVTCDHHEFDVIERSEKPIFHWIR